MGFNPVAWRGASGGIATIKELDTNELRDLAYVVLSRIASNNGVGTVNVSTNTSLTLVGTYEDHYRGSNTVGGSNVQIGIATYQIRQNLVSGDLSLTESTPPGFHYTSNTAYPLVEANTTVYETLANNILTYCTTTEGPNSYRLGPYDTSPAGTYGGTWEIVASINNYSYAAVGGLIAQYALWRRVDDGGYTALRPLKTGSANGTLNQFSNTDINNIANIVRQRIIDTGLATYSLGESAPGTGTWSAVGAIIDSLAEATADYTASYLGPVTYTGDYFGPVNTSADYSVDVTYYGPGIADTSYIGDFTNPNVNPFTDPDGVSYVGSYTGNNVNPFTNPDAIPFVAIFSNPDVNPFVGPDGSGPFAGDPVINPDANAFIGPEVAYVGPDGATFFNTFSTNYVGPEPVGLGGGFRGSYYGPEIYTAGVDYLGVNYYGPGTFLGPPFTGPKGAFSGTYTGNDARPFAVGGTLYVGDNASGPFFVNYYGPTPFTSLTNYTGDNANPFTGVTYYGPGNFSGPATYTGDNVDPFLGPTYLGPANFAGDVTYTGDNATPFIGPTYLGPRTFNSAPITYTGPKGNFFRVIGYLNENSNPFTPTYLGPGNFTGTVNYLGDNANPFNPTYLGPGNFIGTVTYTGDNVNPFAGTYLGPAIFQGGPEITYFGSPVDGPVFYSQNYYGPESFQGPAGQYAGPPVDGVLSQGAAYYGQIPFYGGAFYSPDYLGPGPYQAGVTYFGGPKGGSAYIFPITYYGPGSFSASYFGPATYLGPGTFSSSYYGPATYLGPQAFQGTYAGLGTYLGPEVYTGPDYYGPGPTTTAPYIGLVDYTGGIIDPDGSQYIGAYTDPNAGGPFTTAYTGLLSNYIANPIGVDNPLVLSSTVTLVTKYLWRRIA